MILMIDNYDSFTYNLVQYLGELDAEVVVERNDQITLAEIEKLAPELIPSTEGPANGFLNNVCMSNPHTANPPPAQSAVIASGKRTSRTMRWMLGSPSDTTSE